ncbi:hypothetical protein DICPUDRAFT_90664 [Dictyostelium purpureum]|uniref:Uncharacterized protein n=1 Tax=Dictyostelium purpureum TaxID=5786 RepID=F1A416_DICPU|nr:uncharacterized protein DICPUDRAFT_90664 [Dictyostelium purpureum]EGC29060.1 hypothetical protein DICPUDRAFT_90664 [Dictyostelium purpureum]|eukprot:XP_003294409.1 hypothetical protein DICPUDRAFT_90664 [Dictyostelium purpureum]
MVKKTVNKIDKNANIFSVLDTSDDDNEYIAKEIPVEPPKTEIGTKNNAIQKKQPKTETKSKKEKITSTTSKSSPKSSTPLTTTTNNSNNNINNSSSSKNEEKTKLKKIENEINTIVFPFEKLIGYVSSRLIALALFFFLCFQIKEYVFPIFKNNSRNKIISVIKTQQDLRKEKETLSTKLKETMGFFGFIGHLIFLLIKTPFLILFTLLKLVFHPISFLVLLISLYLYYTSLSDKKDLPQSVQNFAPVFRPTGKNINGTRGAKGVKTSK